VNRSRRSLLDRAQTFYGLKPPYRFERAAPFTISLLLACASFLAMLVAAAFGDLAFGTFRLVYFVYLIAIAIIAAGLSFLPRSSWTLAALCFLELALGLGTQSLFALHLLKESRLPKNERLDAGPPFAYHPLLQEVPTPDYRRKIPFPIAHDSAGIRGAERSNAELRVKTVVATIGGSSTYDVAVPNGKTWPETLERDLGNGYAVLNHGVPGYSTAEHLIQTLFYLDSYGVKPRCALYYIGWNDIRNAYLPHLDPAYADYHLLTQQQDLLFNHRPLITKFSPLAAIFVPWVRYFVNETPLPAKFDGTPVGRGRDLRLERIFREHVEEIVAINNSRNITTLFVGQVLNRAQLKGNARTLDWFPLMRDGDIWPMQARFNGVLDDTAHALHTPVFIPPIDRFQPADFVDKGHFSDKGAAKFAGMLAPFVRRECPVPARWH